MAPFIADAAPNLLSSTESIGGYPGWRGARRRTTVLARDCGHDVCQFPRRRQHDPQQDVAGMMRNLTALSTGTRVPQSSLFVHHTTKDGDSWRGSGVLFADVDAVLELCSEGSSGERRRQWVTRSASTSEGDEDGRRGLIRSPNSQWSAALCASKADKRVARITSWHRLRCKTNERPQPRGRKNRAIEFLTEVYEKAGGGGAADGM